jgi:tRNA(Arg) A34 adenosine deaminase TadA
LGYSRLDSKENRRKTGVMAKSGKRAAGRAAQARDAAFMRRAVALSLANAGSDKGGPFGAVVVKGGKNLGEGANQVTTRRDPTAHAEIVALRQAARRLKTHNLKGAVIYTSCEPCPMCLTAIMWARIGRMVYACSRADAAEAGFDDEWFYRQVRLPVGRRALKATRMLAPEGRRAFRVWAANPVKVEY